MLLTQTISRATAVFTLCALITTGLPVLAQGSDGMAPAQQDPEEQISQNEKPILIAEATCATCGTDVAPLTLLASQVKEKNASLLTDSLWGNLILELAYQRDKDLQKIARRLNLVSIGTMGAIGGIAGGSLAQGIVAIDTLNPPDGRKDSYKPLVIGTALSGATLLLFASRLIANHSLSKQIASKQASIKKRVETILAHMEGCGARCADAKKELSALIGERACREWVELYQSSHQLATTSTRRFSLLNIPGHMD